MQEGWSQVGGISVHIIKIKSLTSIGEASEMNLKESRPNLEGGKTQWSSLEPTELEGIREQRRPGTKSKEVQLLPRKVV